MKHSQTAVEAAILIGFMSLALMVFLAVSYQNTVELQEKANVQMLNDVMSVIEAEVDLAVAASDGYYRQFALPFIVNGKDYIIKFIGTDLTKANFTEFEIKFANQTVAQSIVTPKNVMGNICKGKNVLSKNSGLVNISCVECSNRVDDDANGCSDYPIDMGCENSDDQFERGGLCRTQCSDSQDNDNNGCPDYPLDNGCFSLTDDSESGGICQCSDGTPFGSCSADKPRYCSGGTLIDACGPPQNCGCNAGFTCQNNVCIPV